MNDSKSRQLGSKAVDDILRVLAVGGAVTTAMIMPNLLVAIEKPLHKYLDKLDERERKREKMRLIYYLKSQGLVTGDYQHGLAISEKGRKRLQRQDTDAIAIQAPQDWGGQWRMIFYDIPETYKAGRRALAAKVRQLGYRQIQRSVWVHPFESRESVEKIAVDHGVNTYVSYVVATHIDNQEPLVSHFQKLYPDTKF